MKIKVHLVIDDDDGHEETITDVVVLEKACQQIEQVGLTLAEAKSLLAALQQQIVERQAAAFLAKGHALPDMWHCPPHQGAPRPHLPDALWDHQADQSTAPPLPVRSSGDGHV